MKNLSDTITRTSITANRDVLISENSIKPGELYVFKTDIGSHDLFIVLNPKTNVTTPIKNDIINTFEQTNTDKLFLPIKHFFSRVECVKTLLFLKKNDVIHIWTAIADYDTEANRRLVYKEESQLMKYLSTVHLDFNFCLIELEEIEEILSAGATIIFDKRGFI